MQMFQPFRISLNKKWRAITYLYPFLFSFFFIYNVHGQSADSVIVKKADFILEVSSNINFPQSASNSNYKIGVLGKGKDIRQLCDILLQRYADLNKENVTLEVLQFKKAKAIVPVDLMYVSSESKIRLSELNTKLGSNPYVIITESFPFGTSLLNFAMDDNGGLFFELQDQAYLSRGARIEKAFLNSPKRAVSEEEWTLRLQGVVKVIDAQEVIINNQDKELVEQDVIINDQRSWVILLSLSLLIICFLGVITFRMMRQKNIVLSELAEKNRSIVINVNYAKKIQDALLPDTKLLNRISKENFIWYQPKEIVSGDFYWIEEVEDKVFFAVADCTGHGVPGAFVSVLCINGLTKVVKELKIEQPSLILDETVNILKQYFEKSNQSLDEGMDLALCCYNTKTKVLEYSGANNPLYLVIDGKLSLIKPDKQPVGKHIQRKKYTNHSIQISKGQSIYLFTDGIIDQFGGPDDKKFGSRRFQKAIVKNNTLKMAKQKEELVAEFSSWMVGQQQLDDICMLGLKF